MICGSSKPKNENEVEEVEGFQSAHAEPSSNRKMEEKLSKSPMVKKLCFEEHAKSGDKRSGPINLEDYLISDDDDDSDNDDDKSDHSDQEITFNSRHFMPCRPSQILPPFEDYDDELFVMLRQSSKNALAEYNKENGTNYKFFGYVEIENSMEGAGDIYRITFEAKQPPINKATTFEATVYQLIGGNPNSKPTVWLTRNHAIIRSKCFEYLISWLDR